MPAATHCLPSGSLGTSELPVPSICDARVTTFTPTGAKRGIVVWLHGMQSFHSQIPIPVVDFADAIFPSYALTFANALKADGWIVVAPLYLSDTYNGKPSTAIFNDVNADAAHGSRYLTNMLHWWDHVKFYLQNKYNPAMPVVPFGVSWGGWHALQLAVNRQSDIAAYGAHVPATILSKVLGFSPDFTTLNSSGLDIPSTALNAITKPGIIGWGTNDPLVPFADTQTLYNTAHTAGAPVTSNATTDTHSFTQADSATYASWFASAVDPSCLAVF